MKVLVKNPIIVNADSTDKADILMKGGKIAEIAQNIEIQESVQIIDATGLYAFPGGIDPHVHLELPTPAGNSSDDFYTGSMAALAGGTTTIIDFVTPIRGQSIIEAIKQRKKEAEKSLIDYSLHCGITSFNENTAEEINQCIHTEGITSFKAYLAYLDTIGINYDELKKIMQVIAGNDAILAIHCEDGEEIYHLQQKYLSEQKTSPAFHPLSRPENAESDAVAKVIKIAEETACKTYIVHVSSKKAIEIIARNKSHLRLFSETCPHYLLLDETGYHKNSPDVLKYILSPPLRNKKSQDALWEHIADGTIDVISTDHCPFNSFGQKDAGTEDFTKIPNGAGSIEYRLPLLYTYGVLKNKISLNRFVELTSANAAKIYGLYPKKGVIAEGSDADIVLWNPDAENIISVQTQFQNCDSNIYEGFPVKGVPDYVIRGGHVAFAHGKHNDENLKGNFLKGIR